MNGLCELHRKQLVFVAGIQRSAKRWRDSLNRSPSPRPHGDLKARRESLLSRLNAEIRWRQCALWQISITHGGCQWCRLTEDRYGQAFSFKRLASSMAEHLISTQDVVGSSPARDSIGIGGKQ